MPRTPDLFLSFHRHDAEPARRLAAALEARGLATAAAGGGRSSPGAGLPAEFGAARIVVAWASEAYFRARHCQTELAAAFIAGSREPPTAPERLLLINAEAGVKHIYPTHLRDLVVAPAPGLPDSWSYDELAESLRDHCESISGNLGGLCPLGLPAGREAFDSLLLAGPRFEGRDRELWDIHDALHAPGAEPPGPVVVSAGSGQGKSALAREYAFRFGPAYPGGVFRLSAAETKPAAGTMDARDCPALRLQLAAFLGRDEAAGIDPDRLDIAALSRHLGERLAAAGRPFLWIVDDLPDRLSGAAFRAWLAPAAAAPLGRTLLLTRHGRYHQRATALHLPPLDPHSAYRLLTRDAAPVGDAEEEAVAGLLDELGRQPMGLAVAGELAHLDRRNRQGRYANLLRRLDAHGPAAEELAARLPDEWPRASEVSIASVLLHALATLEEPGRDLLRLAAILPDTTLALDFAADCLARSGLGAAGRRPRSFALFLSEPVNEPLAGESAAAHAKAGAALLEQLCFGERTAHGIRVHPLAARATALTDPEPARSLALERAVLDALVALADADEPAAAWQRLAPLSTQARRMALDIAAELEDGGEDPTARNRRLRLACLLAEIDAARGARGEALQAYRGAARLLLRAITEEPGNGRRQRDFAEVQERLGELLEAEGNLRGALDCYRKSLGIRTLASQPGGATRPSEVLRHHEKIGTLQEALADPEGALHSYRAAHGFIQKRAARRDADAERRFRLASSHRRIGLLCRELEDIEGMEAAFAAAAPILAQLAAECPDRVEFARLWSELEGVLGDGSLTRKSFEAARRRYAAALAAAEAWTGLEPDCGAARENLAQCHSRLGNTLAALREPEGAAAEFRAYIALAEQAVDPDYPDALPPRDLAVAHIKLGIALESFPEPDRAGALVEYLHASALLERLLEPDPKDPLLGRDLAWVSRRIKIMGGREPSVPQRAPGRSR